MKLLVLLTGFLILTVGGIAFFACLRIFDEVEKKAPDTYKNLFILSGGAFFAYQIATVFFGLSFPPIVPYMAGPPIIFIIFHGTTWVSIRNRSEILPRSEQFKD